MNISKISPINNNCAISKPNISRSHNNSLSEQQTVSNPNLTPILRNNTLANVSFGSYWGMDLTLDALVRRKEEFDSLFDKIERNNDFHVANTFKNCLTTRYYERYYDFTKRKCEYNDEETPVEAYKCTSFSDYKQPVLDPHVLIKLTFIFDDQKMSDKLLYNNYRAYMTNIPEVVERAYTIYGKPKFAEEYVIDETGHETMKILKPLVAIGYVNQKYYLPTFFIYGERIRESLQSILDINGGTMPIPA